MSNVDLTEALRCPHHDGTHNTGTCLSVFPPRFPQPKDDDGDFVVAEASCSICGCGFDIILSSHSCTLGIRIEQAYSLLTPGGEC